MPRTHLIRPAVDLLIRSVVDYRRSARLFGHDHHCCARHQFGTVLVPQHWEWTRVAVLERLRHCVVVVGPVLLALAVVIGSILRMMTAVIGIGSTRPTVRMVVRTVRGIEIGDVLRLEHHFGRSRVVVQLNRSLLITRRWTVHGAVSDLLLRSRTPSWANRRRL